MAHVDTSDFTRKLNALMRIYRQFPTEIATIAVKFSKERFRDQAWLDESPQAWTPRRRSRRGATGRITRNQTLLLKTGRLKRSIRKISATTDRIIIGTDVPYAQIHNEGGTINTTVTVRAHTRTRRGRSENVRGHSRRMNLNIPQRQFLGNSQVLQQRIFSHITARFNSVLNN